jgi:hypothetical protein
MGEFREHARETNRRLDAIEHKLDEVLSRRRAPSWVENASSALSAAIGAHAGKMAVVVILVTLATIFGLSPSKNFVPELSPLQGSHQ